MQIAYESIYEVVTEVVASAALTEPGKIQGDQDLIMDLELDSLAVFEVVVDLEEAFQLQISDDIIDGLHTCNEIAAYIYKEVNQ